MQENNTRSIKYDGPRFENILFISLIYPMPAFGHLASSLPVTTRFTVRPKVRGPHRIRGPLNTREVNYMVDGREEAVL